MFNIQVIKKGRRSTPSGAAIVYAAFEDFSEYSTGFRDYYQGSGLWLTSGQSYSLVLFINDAYSGYSAGTYRYNQLNAYNYYQGFSNYSGKYSGNLYSTQMYMSDSYQNYPTGYYSGMVLTGQVYQLGYIANTGNPTGYLFYFSGVV